MIPRFSFLVIAAALIPFACGGSVTVTSGGTGSGSGSTGSGGGVQATSPCPAAAPEGGSCDGVPEGFRCTYGDSVRPDCRTEWTCDNGTWTTTKGVCLGPPPAHCMFTEPPGGVCGQEGDICPIGSTVCICSSCAGGPCMAPPPQWKCGAPPTGQGCPATIPNDGTSCSAEGAACAYGVNCTITGAQVHCKNGLWIWDPPSACPV